MEQRDHNRPQVYSARQRTIVITFETPEAAQAWDEAGSPIADLQSGQSILTLAVA